MRKILLCLSHAIEEHDQLRLFCEDLGCDAWSLGGYIDPHHPHVDMRPPVFRAQQHPELRDAVDAIGVDDNIAAAQHHIPDMVLQWLGDDGVICFHHYLESRLVPQWPRLRDWARGNPRRKIVWRTVGQSVENTERTMAPLRAEGLRVVRYSAKERAVPGYCGEDALIRFWADPAEWGPWTGEDLRVLQVTQHLLQRDPWTNWAFWEEATAGLPRLPLGPGSEAIGGPGRVSEQELRAALRSARCYLYTGTQPASYTLAFMEAMMTGVPIVSIGPAHMRAFAYGSDLFEGHELAWAWSDNPAEVRTILEDLLTDDEKAAAASRAMRQRAIEEFSREKIARQWREFLEAA